MITVLIVFAVIVGGVGGFAAFLAWLDKLREPGNKAYREESRERIDESLGRWGHESMIARDRRRGHGRFAKSRGVREEP